MITIGEFLAYEREQREQQIKLGGAARKRYAWLLANGHPQGDATRQLALKHVDRTGREKNHSDDSSVDSQRVNSGPTQGYTAKSTEKSSSSFRQAVQSVTIGVIPVEYPNTFLKIEQMRAIQDAVDDKVLDQRNKELKPRFQGIGFKAGWMSFECNDEATATWLKETIASIQPWEGARLKAVKGGDLPRANIMVAYFPNCSHMKTDKILAFIDSQNDGIRTETWRVISRKDEGTLAVITFALDSPTSELLKKQDFKIHFRYGTVQLKSRGALMKEQTGKPEEKKADPVDHRSNGDSGTPCLQKSAEVKSNSKRQRRRGRKVRQKEQEAHKKTSTGAIPKAQSNRDLPSANSNSDQQPSTSKDTPGPSMANNQVKDTQKKASCDSRPGKSLRTRTVQTGYPIFTRSRTGSNGQRGEFRK